MPEKRDLTPHQQKIVRAYYENQGAIREQSLSELVGDLFLATTEARRKALWARADKLLAGLKVPDAERAAIVSARDTTRLAEVAARRFRSDRAADWARDAKDERRD